MQKWYIIMEINANSMSKGLYKHSVDLGSLNMNPLFVYKFKVDVQSL